MAEMNVPTATSVGGSSDQPPADQEPDDSVVVFGLPKHASVKDIEKLFAAHVPGHTVCRVRVKPSVAIVKFECTEARDNALAALNGQKVVLKHYTLTFNKALTSGARAQKRKAMDSADGEPKRVKTVEEAVTPLHAMPYEEQLALKAESIREVLGTLAKRLLKANLGGAWLTRQIAKANGGRVCEQAEIVRAPTTKGYRNKCEFTIGKDADGRACVGFKLGLYRDGVTTIGDPSNCSHISAEMKAVVSAVQAVVAASPLPVWSSAVNGGGSGFWRQLLVRQNLRAELLISIMVRAAVCVRPRTRSLRVRLLLLLLRSRPPPHRAAPPRTQVNMPSDSEAAADGSGEASPARAKELALLEVNKAVAAAGRAATVACAFFQAFGGCSNPPVDLPHTHLSGARELVEELRGVRFRVSPSAFFQVNTGAADVLGGLLESLVLSFGPEITLLDVCCGTGAWGLCLASKVARVVGVEVNAEAVQDARKNASDNGISNAQFVCGRAEDVIDKLLLSLGDRPCVAIVDPPRGGLHVNVLKALRGCRQLRHLIYVSCNPNSWVDDCERLCGHTSKAYRGDPFRPVRATPVDLFPDTAHCELVVTMTRLPPNMPGDGARAPAAAHAPAAAGGDGGGGGSADPVESTPAPADPVDASPAEAPPATLAVSTPSAQESSS